MLTWRSFAPQKTNMFSALVGAFFWGGEGDLSTGTDQLFGFHHRLTSVHSD